MIKTQGEYMQNQTSQNAPQVGPQSPQPQPPAPSPQQTNPPVIQGGSPQVTQNPQGQNPPNQEKKGGLLAIIIIIIVVLAVLIGGGYFVMSYLKNKARNALEGSVKNQVNNIIQGASSAVSSSSGNPGGASQNDISSSLLQQKSGTDFSSVKEQTPTGTFPSLVNRDIQPVLADLFGGAKVDQWSGTEDGSVYISYITKNSVSGIDSKKIESAFSDKGFQIETFLKPPEYP